MIDSIRHIVLIVIILLFVQSCGPSARMSNYNAYRVPQVPVTTIPAGTVKVTFLGTTTILFDDGETQLITDGFFSRPSFGKVIFSKIGADTTLIKKSLEKYGIDRLQAVFTCHSHYDHAMDAPYVAKYTNAELHGSPSTLNIGKGAQLSEAQLKVYEPGVEKRFGNFSVTVIESKHSPPIKVLGIFKTKEKGSHQIETPLAQPAKQNEYAEGGTYDLLIKHGEHNILFKGSGNYIEGALTPYDVDVFMLGIPLIGKESEEFRQNYYEQTVGSSKPELVIPIHWDNFFKPLNNDLKANSKMGDNVKKSLNFMIERTNQDNIQFKILQGEDSILLF